MAMNILRTMQKDEDYHSWVKLLFREGPYDGNNVPAYPLQFPFPVRIQSPVTGGYLYLVYRGQIIGYGRIEQEQFHQGTIVGTEGQIVMSGSEVTIDGPLQKMPFTVPCKGFQGFRYTDKNLHEIEKQAALKEIRRLKLEPRV